MDGSLYKPRMGPVMLLMRALLGASVCLGVPSCAGGAASPPQAPSLRQAQGLMARTSFALGPPSQSLPPATPLVTPMTLVPVSLLVEEKTGEQIRPVLASEGRASKTRVTGIARVGASMAGLANVRDGHVTGTPVWVRDARTGRRLAETITFYDGSFALDVSIGSEGLPVVVSTDLVDAKDPNTTVWLGAPVYLDLRTKEHDLVLGAGATALTVFLQAVARSSDDLPGPLLGDDVFAAGPRFGALVTGIDEAERDSFARLAESAPEIREAQSLVALREGISRFVERIAQRSD